MSLSSELLQQKIEKLMSFVPSTPKGFEKWIRTSAFKNSKYIFYKRKGKKVYGLCSKCGEKVDVSKAKHNKTGRCPACNAKITYKAINKAKRYEDTVIVSIMQKMLDGNYIVRYFEAYLTFKDAEDTSCFPEKTLETLTIPKMRIWEGSREVIKIQKNGKTKIKAYEWLWNYYKGKCEWRKEHKRSGFFNRRLLRDSKPFIYKRNLKKILNHSKWKYSGLDYLKQSNINITNYLYTYEEYQALELLSKLNMTNLLDDIIYRTIYWGSVDGAIKIHEKMLGLNKKVFNTAVRLNLKIRGIEFISTLDEIGKNLTDEQILWAIKNSNTETFTQLLRFISPQKVINYAEKHCCINDKRNFITTWRDYLEQCEKLKLDTKSDFILFPKNLEEKHAEYTKLIRLIANKKLDQGIKAQYNKWNDILSYQSKNLKIEVAGSHKLILKEGEALRHCVGSTWYSENMAKGKKLILFLRKNNKPYYTIEFDVEELKIIQIRGFRNKAPSKVVTKFINKWKVRKLLAIREIKKVCV